MEQQSLKISNETLVSNSENPESNYLCYCFYCYCCRWSLSIVLWFLIIFMIVQGGGGILCYISFIFIYFIYLPFEFGSQTHFLLLSQSYQKFDKLMSDYFEAFPKIFFKTIDGKEIPFTNYFCKDISKKWILNNEELKRKYFIRLKIISELYMNDQNTKEAYIRQRLNFIKFTKDSNITTEFNYNNLNLKFNYFFCLENKKCKWFTAYWAYIILNILTFGEIYSLILKLITIEKSYTIKKLITINNDVNIIIRGENNKIEKEIKINYDIQENQLEDNKIDKKDNNLRDAQTLNSERNHITINTESEGKK